VQTLYHPERIAAPLVRTGPRGSGQWKEVPREDPRGSGQWKEVPREEAIAQLSERLGELRESGRPESLALLAGYCAGTMRDLWSQFLKAFGSPNYVADEYADGTDAIMQVMHGMRRRPGYDLERSETVLSFGAPLFESWWSPLQAFVAFADPEHADRRRPHFVQVDTRFSRTAARSHEWVAVRPGTHAVLALGIAYILIRDELYDAEFVAEHVAGFEDSTDEQGRLRPGYRSRVSSNYRTEEVSAITGVPVERISSLARSFAQNVPAVAVCGEEVMRAPNGLLAGLAVHSLNLLMGSVNRPGTVLFGKEPPLGPLAEPVLDATALAGLERVPVAGGESLFGAENLELPFAERVAAGSEGAVGALLLYYANPLASSARPEVWQDALEKIPFVVSFSPFLDETTRHADMVLPDLLPYERWQDAPTPRSYPYPVWSVNRPLVEPPEGGTHTAEALLAIATNLGGSVAQSLPYEGFDNLLKARAQGLYAARRGTVFGSEFEREHHRQMEQRGWWLPVHTDFEAFWRELVERGGWTDLYYDDTDPGNLSATPDGRIHLLPPGLLDALQVDAREPYIDVAPPATPETDDYPLQLIPYRLSTLASGTLSLQRWLAERPNLFPEVYWHPWVEVNPVTAQELGLSNDARIRVVSASGRYEARVKVFSGAAPGSVSAPYGLRHPDGAVASPLQLLDGTVDPQTGLQSWFSTRVRLDNV
jgi:anaerobic selenocysteine-containing dehydrogenase